MVVGQRTRPGFVLQLVSVPEQAGTQMRWLWRTGGAEVAPHLVHLYESPLSGIACASSAFPTCPHLHCGKGNLSESGTGNTFRQDRSSPYMLAGIRSADCWEAEGMRCCNSGLILTWQREAVFCTLLCLLLCPGASLSSSPHFAGHTNQNVTFSV